MKSTVLVWDSTQYWKALLLLVALALFAAGPAHAQGQQQRGGKPPARKTGAGQAPARCAAGRPYARGQQQGGGNPPAGKSGAGKPPANGENMSSAGAGVSEA